MFLETQANGLVGQTAISGAQGLRTLDPLIKSQLPAGS